MSRHCEVFLYSFFAAYIRAIVYQSTGVFFEEGDSARGWPAR